MEYFIWNVDPNIVELGSIQLHWYGLFFVGSFFLGLMILDGIYKREGKSYAVLDNLPIYLVVGVAFGARLVHCFFYEPDFYLSHPLEILAVWKGGLASHGGLAGVLITLYIFSKRYNESYAWLLARITIPGALTAAFVRFGNFFNSEVLGKPSELPWAIVFQRIDLIPRHPVQLYEAFAYLAIFALLITIYYRVTPTFATRILPGVFLVTLFTARFFIEYAKTRQAAYVTGLPFSTGQMLSVPFIVVGIIWIIWAFKTKEIK